MSVTQSELTPVHRPRERSRDSGGPHAPRHEQRERAADEQRAAAPHEEQSERAAQGSEAHPSAEDRGGEKEQTNKTARGGIRIGGYLLIFLILGGYFAWIGQEMGSHAVSGTIEMGAIFGAIFIAVVALLAGGASMRHQK